jgi:parallel beta-helix repeat protein
VYLEDVHRALRLFPALLVLAVAACRVPSESERTSISSTQPDISRSTQASETPENTVSIEAGNPDGLSPGEEFAGDPNTFFVSTDGDDDSDGTFADPWRTLPFAVEQAPLAATVVVLPGDFTEAHNQRAVIINRNESPDRPFRLVGIDKPLVTSGGDISGIRVIQSSNIVIDGFRIRGEVGSRHGTGIYITEGSHDITARNNHVSDFGAGGIGVDFGDRIVVEDNWVENNSFASSFQTSGLSSFRAKPVGDDNWMRFSRNVVIGNHNTVPSATGMITDGNCIIIDLHTDTDYFGLVTIDSNLCVENGGRGIHIFHSTNVVATNNTLIGNVWSPELAGAGELSVYDGSDIRFANNLVVPSGAVPPLSLVQAGVVVFEGNVVAGPDAADGFSVVNVAELGFDLACELPFRYAPSTEAPVVGISIGAFEALDLIGVARAEFADVGAIEALPDQLC